MKEKSYLVPVSGRTEDRLQMQNIMRSVLDKRYNKLGMLYGSTDRTMLSFATILISLKNAASFFF